MKTIRINSRFESFGRFQIRHRVAFLVVLAFIRADDVFDPEVLDAIDRLGDEILQNVPYVERVTSLMSLSVPIGTEDGFEVFNPFEGGIPEDQAEIDRIRDFILTRESLVNVLVSDDCTETWVIFNLEQYSESLEEAMNKIAPPAMEIFNSERYKSDKYEILPAGLSYTEYEENLATIEQCVSRIAIGFAVMVLFLIIFVRSFKGVIVPALATVFALCTTLGYSALMGIEGNRVMIIVALLLAIVVIADGKVVEEGSPAELMAKKKGIFRHMSQLQSASSDWGL